MEDDDIIFKPKYKQVHEKHNELKESNTTTLSDLNYLKSKEDDFEDMALDFQNNMTHKNSKLLE